MFEDTPQVREPYPAILEEIQGAVSPWYEKIGKPVIFSSILAPGRISIFDNFSCSLPNWRSDPANRQYLLSDIDAFRRIPMDEAIAHLACDPTASHRLLHFEQHFGYQFYKNTGNPKLYLRTVQAPSSNNQH